MLGGMVKTRIGELARAAGYEKPHHFQRASGLAPATAYRLYNDEAQGIDLATIDFLCGFFGCGPGDLFVLTTVEAKSRTAREGAWTK